MRIAIGSDHRGYIIKRKIAQLVERLGHTVEEYGATSEDPVDYPDSALEVGKAVASGQVDRGILIDGTGIGMNMAANKVHGVRAALCHDDITAELSRRHNDANVMCLSADLLGERLIDRMVEIWLATDFEGGRHARRVEKIKAIEQSQCRPAGPASGGQCGQ